MWSKKKEYVFDDNLLHLKLESQNEVEYSRDYNFQADNHDPQKADAFNEIAGALMQRLAKGHVVSYTASYKLLKSSRKKWFQKERIPATYLHGEAIDKLKSRLEAGVFPDVYFAVVESRDTSGWFHSENKSINIVEEQLNMKLLEECANAVYNDSGEYHKVILVFQDQSLPKGKTSQEIVEHYTTAKFMIYFHTDMGPEAEISINTQLYPEEKLISVIREVAKEFNKTLEVHL